MNNLNEQVTLDGALSGASSRRVWLNHIQKHWRIYSLGVLTILVCDAGEVAVPKIIQNTIDIFVDVGRPNRVTAYHHVFIALLFFLIAQFVGRIGWRMTLGQQTHFTAAQMKSLIWNRARFFPRKRLESDLSPGELMNIATGDVGTARFIFGFTLVGTVDFIVILVSATALMLSIDPVLTLVALIPLPILPFFLDRLARAESVQHKESQEALSHLTDLAAQSVGTIRMQRTTQTGPFWEKKLLESAETYRQLRLKVVKTGLAFIPPTGLAPIVSYILLFLIGTKKVMNGELSLGGFVALQSFIGIIQGPLFELGVNISEWQRCFASLNRITRVLAQPEAEQLREGGQGITVSPEVFKVSGLLYSYDTDRKPTLENLNFTLQASEKLGIKGPIGSGKTTLIQILSGFERSFQGSVELYGQDIRSYAHLALRECIGIVPQKPFLFADTIRNNIRMNHEVSDDEIWRLLEITELVEDVSHFPDKLETRLGEWGINLSGGQKQRLTLARALAAKPRIILLDDCLSAVDTVTEERILGNVDREIKNLTAVWVAHRDSTLRYCDKIMELQA